MRLSFFNRQRSLGFKKKISPLHEAPRGIASTAWIKFLWIRDLPNLEGNCFEIQD